VYHKTLSRLCLSAALLNLCYFCPAQNRKHPLPAIGLQSPAAAHRQGFAEEALRLGLKGEYVQALETLNRAQLEAEKNADKAGSAMVIIDSVLIYFFQGNNLKALATYQKMPPIAEIESDQKALAHVLSRRAFLGYYRNGFAQALKDAQRSLALLDPATDKIERGFTLNVLGMIESAMGNSQAALKALQDSLAICQQMGDEFWMALPLNNLGYVYHLLDNQTQALKYYHQSLALIERFAMRALLHYTLNNIGAAHLSEGAYAQALPYFQRSLAERQTNGKADEISTTLRDLGSTYRDLGDYASAQEYYGKSLAIEEKLQNPLKIAGRLLNIGFVYVCQQNFGMGFVYFQRSLALAEASDDKEGIARAYMSIGDLHLFQNSYDLALDYYQKALPVAAASGHKALIASISQNIGTAYREKGDYQRALSYYQDYFKSPEVATSKTMQAHVLLNTGLTYQLQSDYDKALTYYQEFMELNGNPGNRQLLCTALSLSGAVYQARGDYAKALSLAEQGNVLARQLGNFHVIAYSRLITGRAFHSLRQLEKARQSYDEAIAAIENIRSQVIGSELEQQRFFEKRITPYSEIIALLIEQNKTDEAFAYAERAKARTLVEVLQSGRINITKAMTATEQEQEQRLRNELFSINSQILKESLRQKPEPTRLPELNAKVQKARFNYEAFQMNLYIAHAELRGKRGEAQPLKSEECGALLEDAKSLLLEYVVTDERTYLFAISKGASPNRSKIDVKVYAIAVTRKALSAAAEDFRKQLGSRDIGFREAARRLYDLLLKPAQNDLQGKNHIVIVPDGALWDLPFQALQPAANRYFIEDAAISYAPSLSALREMRKPRRTYGESATLMAFGNPALSNETLERNRIARRDEKLEPLPEAEKEVKELAQLYGVENSRIYIGAAAREDLLKAEAGKFKVLHIAAHGVLNDANPLYSRIVLAQGESNEDGLLEAWEIMKLDLKADLVVLSACNTARGRIGAGEGVIGLTWALFVAGSPTTVVSQWKVDSASTSQLMTDFHRNLKNLKPTMSKAEALRAASLKMLQSSEYKHPFYWAGFVVIGNGF
jgi:CHAT domain-containing protein